MAEMKWIRHPDLPDGQEVEVRADAVRHYAMSGWQPLDEPPEWARVRLEDEALASLADMTADRRDAMRLAASDSGTDTESVPGNDDSADESGSDSADQTDGTDEQTGAKRVRRASSAPKGDK